MSRQNSILYAFSVWVLFTLYLYAFFLSTFMKIAQDEDDKRKCSFVKFSERNNCILYIHLVIVVNFDASSLTLCAIFFVELWAANGQRCVKTIVKSTYLMNDSDLCTSYRVICTVYYDALRIFPMAIRKIFWNIFRGHCELVAVNRLYIPNVDFFCSNLISMQLHIQSILWWKLCSIFD